MAHPNSGREGTQYMYIKQEAIWLWLNCCSTSDHWAVHVPSQHPPSQHTTFTHHLTAAYLLIESLHHLHIHQYTKWLQQYHLYALRCDISYWPLELSLKHLQTLTPIGQFPMDILHSVLNKMAIPWVMALGSTSTDMELHIQEHLKHWLSVALMPSKIPIGHLRSVLWTSHTVISGSIALCFMLPLSAHVWTPSDMDLYTMTKGFSKIMAFLIIHRYNFVVEYTGAQCPRGVGEPNVVYEMGFGIKQVMKMQKGDHSVNIIISWTTSPLSPIFHFHSTAVMNFISAYGFFSTYPKITNLHFSIINPVTFKRRAPSARILACFEKYTHWGFTCYRIEGPGCAIFGCPKSTCPEAI